jgi:hypothetical protein
MLLQLQLRMHLQQSVARPRFDVLAGSLGLILISILILSSHRGAAM